MNEPLSNLPPIPAALLASRHLRHDAVVEVGEAELGGEDDGVVGAERQTRLEDDALKIVGVVHCRH